MRHVEREREREYVGERMALCVVVCLFGINMCFFGCICVCLDVCVEG